MTFKEKWEMEHPGENLTIDDLASCCPEDFGYEPAQNYNTHCQGLHCSVCWNREIPGTEPTNKIKNEKEKTNMTKNELLEQIADLKKEVEKLERYKQYETFAGEVGAMKKALVANGFTDDQAVELVKVAITGAAMMMKN